MRRNDLHVDVLRVLLTCATVYGAATADAATVTSVGAQLNVGAPNADGSPGSAAGWRTASVTKTLDIDGDDIYGSLGYVLFNPHAFAAAGTGQGSPLANVNQSLPSYLSVAATGATLSFSGNYTTIDDPANPAGAPLWSGIAYTTGVSAGSEIGLFNVTFAAGTPANTTFRLGIFVDNIAPVDGSPFGLRVTGASGDSGLVNKAQATQVNNYYFFDLDNVVAGDTFSIITRRSGSGTGAVGIGGLTFDAIPEPATALLLLLGALSPLPRRRRGDRGATSF